MKIILLLQSTLKKGGIAAIYENGYITIKKGDWKIRVEKATHIPLTFGGSVGFYDPECAGRYTGNFFMGL